MRYSGMLSDAIPRGRIRNKLKKFLFVTAVIIFAFFSFSIIVYAEVEGGGTIGSFTPPPDGWEAKNDEWGGLLNGLYKSLIIAFQDGLYQICCGAFITIDSVVESVEMYTTATPSEFETATGLVETASIYPMIEKIANNVVAPIGTVIFCLIVMYDLVCMLMEKNNFHEFDTSIFLRFCLKSVIGVWFLSHVFSIVNGLFSFGITIVNGIVGELQEGENLRDINNFLSFLIKGVQIGEARTDEIKGMGLGTGIQIFFPALLMYVISFAIEICSFIILMGRMLELLLYMAAAPIPMSMMASKELSETGKNFMKTIFAYGLHGAFIMVCCAMFIAFARGFAANIGGITWGSDIGGSINTQFLSISGFGVLMIFLMFKSGGIAKSIVGAH